MNNRLEKRVQALTAYAIISTLIFSIFIFSSFRNSGKNDFDEINVKRINILAEDGSLRMVLSNESRQFSGRANGKDLQKRNRPAGIIFFNNEGDECGGLLSYANKKNGTTNSGMSFTMDQYHNDQVVQITNDEVYQNNQHETRRGLAINAIPFGVTLDATMQKYYELQKISDSTERKQKIRKLIDEEGIKNRLFIGKNEKNEYGLFMADSTGKIRFQIYLDKKGNPEIQTTDSNGNTKSFLDK